MKIVSRLFLYFGSLSLVLFCLPLSSNFLLKGLEKYPPLTPPVSVSDEQAIVVLSGGSYQKPLEYGKSIDGHITIQRDLYAAFLHKQTGLPVLVTGGKVKPDNDAEAAVMTDTLKNSFNVNVMWQEEASLNTAENAFYSAAILKNNNIDSIYLVTHAWHMPRSVMMFEKQGINVTPAPTIFVAEKDSFSFIDFIPSASALYKTRIALHEYVGILWYNIRYN